jgi:hypothetical protein
VPIKTIKYPILIMCFATAEFSGWCRCIYLWCFLHVVLKIFQSVLCRLFRTHFSVKKKFILCQFLFGLFSKL